jgi:hypothetical protein
MLSTMVLSTSCPNLGILNRDGYSYENARA